MARRNATTTETVTRETRLTFTAADLRKRLRLPDDAALAVMDPEGFANGVVNIDDLGIVATFTRTKTNTPKKEGSA